MVSITSRAARAFVLIAAGVAGPGLQGTVLGQLETSPLPATIQTELVGRVLAPDGTTASGAVVVSSAGGTVVTGADGSFGLQLVLPVDAEAVRVTAVLSTGAGNLIASAQVAGGARWGTTDAGILQLAPSAACQPAWLPTFGQMPGLSHTVNALAVFDDGTGPALYAGGAFVSAGSTTAAHIVRWDGSAWSPVGGGTSKIVSALAVYDDGSGPALYAAGSFVAAGGVSAAHIARWDGVAWSAVGGGTDGSIRALTVFDGGTGPMLCAAGPFFTAGGVPALRVAAWNGTHWTNLGTGLPGQVFALAAFDDGSGNALYAGGGFASMNGVPLDNIARWNGTSWSGVGGGIGDVIGENHTVYALATFDDGSGPAIYAGGSFKTAGGASALNIARWNGSMWSAVGSGISGNGNGGVSALAVVDCGSGPVLCAAGFFPKIDDMIVNHIATWDGAAWSPLGDGLGGAVLALANFDDGSGAALFVGGGFTTTGGEVALNIAKWQGSTWSPIGHGIAGGRINALAVFDDGSGPALFAGGAFTGAGGVTVNRIAKWDGATWTPLGSGVNKDVYSLAVFDDGSGPALYAGGAFNTAGGVGGVTVNHIARWNGASWSALGTGVNGYTTASVKCLAVFDDGSGPALYAGGDFISIGDVPANRIARWNGSAWSPLGGGLTGGTTPGAADMVVYDDGTGPALVVGGRFLEAGGVTVNSIAAWDGTSWSSLASGVNDDVTTLGTFDDGSGTRLYAAGSFTSAGGVTATRIASWNGASWSPLGSGLNSSQAASALTVYDDGSGPALYASGEFSTAGGIAANNIARWDGAAWSSLGAGIGAQVDALVVFDDGAGPALIASGSSFESKDTSLSRWGGCSASPWTDLGFALAGAGGTPMLQGVGSLAVGAPLTLSLTHAAPSALTILFLSGSSAPLPFKGGTLLPVPPLVALSFATNASGGIHLSYPAWPAGASGLSLYFQDAIHDAGAVQGVALSNALRGDVP